MNWYGTTKFAFPGGRPGIPWLPQQLEDIAKYVKAGLPFEEIAGYYGVNKGAIIYLNQKHGWRKLRQRKTPPLTRQVDKDWYFKDQIQEEPDNFNKEQKMNWYKITKFAFPGGKIPEELNQEDAKILRDAVENGETFDELLEWMNSNPNYSISADLLRKLMTRNKIPIPMKTRGKKPREWTDDDLNYVREGIAAEIPPESIAADLGIHPNTLIKKMKELELYQPKRSRVSMSEKTKELIIWLNEHKNKNAKEISEYLNSNKLPKRERIKISPSNIYNFLNKTTKGYQRKETESFNPTRQQITQIYNWYSSPESLKDEQGRPLLDERGKPVEIEGIRETGYSIDWIAKQLGINSNQLKEWFLKPSGQPTLRDKKGRYHIPTMGELYGIPLRTGTEQFGTLGHRARRSDIGKKRQKDIGGFVGQLFSTESKEKATGILNGLYSRLSNTYGENSNIANAVYRKWLNIIDPKDPIDSSLREFKHEGITIWKKDLTNAPSREIAEEKVNNLQRYLQQKIDWKQVEFPKLNELIQSHRDLIKNTVYPGEEAIQEKEYVSPYAPPFIPQVDFSQTAEQLEEKDWYNAELKKEEEIERTFYNNVEEEERRRLEEEKNNKIR